MGKSLKNGLFSVGIFIFDNVELLDFAGPYEVFSVASNINEDESFQIFTISANGGLIQTRDGLKVIADYSFSNHPLVNILIIPGGLGTRTEINNENVLSWIAETHKKTVITVSVCTGALLLGKIGLLDNLISTTHHNAVDLLKKVAPRTRIDLQKRWHDNEHIMTAGGISAGIDISLYIVGKILGNEAKLLTMERMEYGAWQT